MTDFRPYQGCKRKSGTGCVSEINDHLFEGRYSPMWPDGKKHSRNIYAHTREECEEKLKVLIVEMKEEIADIKAGKNPDNIPGGKSKKKTIAAYLRANPQVTNKVLIALNDFRICLMQTQFSKLPSKWAVVRTDTLTSFRPKLIFYRKFTKSSILILRI